jgi:siroheme synthase
VLIVENASLPRERRLHSTLMRLSADIAACEIGSPAVMVIDEVAGGAGELRERELAARSVRQEMA